MSNDTTTFTLSAGDVAPAAYAYGRPFRPGRQDAFILFAKPGEWPSGDPFFEVTYGFGCNDGSGLGCKADKRYTLNSDDLRAFLAVVDPEALRALGNGAQYTVDFASWKNRPVSILVSKDKDRNRSQTAGRDVFRPTVVSVEARAAAPAPAPRGGLL